MKKFLRHIVSAVSACAIFATALAVGVPKVAMATAGDTPSNLAVTSVSSGKVDLSWSARTDDVFDFTFNGTTYNHPYFLANNAIAFGGNPSITNETTGAASPAVPSVQICASLVGMASYQQVYYKIDRTVTPATMRVRVEGRNTSMLQTGSPNIIYETVFYEGQSYFDLLIGVHNGCSDTQIRKGISSGTAWLSQPAFAANTNWRIEGGTATKNGNTATISSNGSASVSASTFTSGGWSPVVTQQYDAAAFQVPVPFGSYFVQYSSNNGTTWAGGPSSILTTSSSVTGLSNGTSYLFRVAMTWGGSYVSPYSATVTGTPMDVPLQPGWVSGSATTRGINLTWTASTDSRGSAVTGYQIRYSTDAGTTWTTAVANTGNTNLSYSLTGLTVGTSYKVSVAAINSVGVGYFYNYSLGIVPFDLPEAPTITSVTGGTNQAVVTWADGANNSATIQSHVVQHSSDGGTTWGGDWTAFGIGVTSATRTGLNTSGSYLFRVKAYNSAGWSAYSAPSAAVLVTTAPGAPTGVTYTSGYRQVSLSWTAPVNTGGSPITGYKISYTDNTGATTVVTNSTGDTNTSYVVTNLDWKPTYWWHVYTVTSVGTSADGAGGSAVPYDLPAAPVTVTPTASAKMAQLTWTDGSTNGSTITNHYAQYSSDGGTTWSTSQLLSTGTVGWVTGLAAATSYVFRLAAVNAAGTGPWSATTTSITTFDVPTAPTNVTVNQTAGNAAVSWTVPSSDGGSAITSYSVQYSSNSGSTWSGSTTVNVPSTSYSYTGLTAGTSYIYRVLATNSGGSSVWSTSSTAQTFFTVPSTVGTVTPTAARLSASLSWGAVGSGGTPLTNYVYSYSSDGGTTWSAGASTGSTGTTYTVTGLAALTSYKFKVAAQNAAGIGSYSAASASVTVYDVPSAGAAPTGVVGSSQVALSWTDGATNGSAITNHYVQYSTDNGSTWSAGVSTASTALSYTYTGLTNGVAYVFRIAAANTGGTGSYSAASTSYTPVGKPTATYTPVGVVGNGQVALSWTAPANDGGYPITDYTIQASSDNGVTWSTTTSVGSNATTYTVTGLTNGTSYKFHVAAYNQLGLGPYSANSSAYIPQGPPAQVTGLTATPNNAYVVISWTAPASNGSGITDYVNEYSSDGGTTWTVFSHTASTATSRTISSLVNGTPYVFRVAAKNAIGTGPYSTVSSPATPFTVPGTPAAPTGTRGNGQVTLAWTAPASNGSAITNYYYQYSSNAGVSWSTAALTGSNASTYTVTGLTNGTSYLFKIAAVNAAGTGTYSANSTAYVPANVPAQVGTVTPTAAANQVALSWAAPATNGAAITDYAVQWSSDSGSTWTTFADAVSTTTSATVTGLSANTSYVFRVAAVNAMGAGAYSAQSTPATPWSSPDAPTGVSATAGVLQASVSWTAPANNGSAITTYWYQYSTDSGLTWSSAVSTGSTATSVSVLSLTANTAYVFRFAAANVAGVGSYSAPSSSVMVYNMPGTPTSVAGAAGLLSATFTWTAPANNGSLISNYRYQLSTDNGSTWATAVSTNSPLASVTIPNLASGTAYKLRVAAENAAGAGSYSTASSAVTPYNVPGAPTSVSGAAGGNKVTLSWTDGAANNSVVTDHQVQWSDDNGTTWSSAIVTGSASTSFAVTGLTAQQPYVFRVASVNAGGAGAWSVVTSPISPYGIPFAPGVPAGVSGNAQVVLSWTAADGNGSAITDYKVRWSSDAGATWSAGSSTGSTSTTYTVTGLTNGIPYVFEVAGVNAGGAGAWSPDSDAVTPATVPNAVGAITVGPSDSQVDLSWSAPANGGNAIVDYLIQYSSNSGTTWINFSDATSASAGVTVTGLTNGTAYVFRIAAVNNVGTGSWSTASSSATPRAVASAPLSLAALAGNTQVSLSWQTPVSNGGMAITDYTVQWSSNSGSTWTTFSHTASTVPSSTVTGLTNGTEYVFRVAAVNSVGTGPWATTNSGFVPYTVAGAPTSVSGTVGNAQVTVSWSAPASNGGSAVTDYLVDYSSDNGSTWATFVDAVSTATSATVTELTNGSSYVFRVKTVNAAGNSPASVTSAAVAPRTVATAVQSVAGTTGNTQVSLTWAAPASNGGAAISDYIVQWSDDNTATWTTFTDGISTVASSTVTGLTNGSSYVFRVAAVNVAGAGPWSLVSDPVVPYTVAGAPTSVTATVGNGQALVSWTAPMSNGGTALTNFAIQWSSDSGSTWNSWSHSPSIMTYATVNGLTNGTAYVFRIAAVNAAGTGSWSTTSSSVTPITVAVAPVITGVTPLQTQVALGWNAPASTGGSTVTDYEVSISTDGGLTWGSAQSVGAVTSVTISGLTNGSAYVFRVRAVNGAGAGDWSTESSEVTPRTLPDAPNSVTGTTGNTQVSLVWSIPAFNGGAPITDYVVQSSSDSGTTWSTFNDGTSTTRAATVTGLVNGTDYIFRVAAVNAAGTGGWSVPSSIVTPRTVPAPPTIDSVVVGNAILTVNFTAGDSGGTTITGYEYSTDNGATWRTRALGLTQSPLVITTVSSDGTSSLANGVTYDVKLRALNSVGVGSASMSWSATPLTVPTVATALIPTPAASGAVVYWTIPSFDGGTSITDYVVQYTTDSGLSWTTFNDGVSDVNAVNVTGLTNGAAYAFRVAAVNSQGTGNWSVTSASVTPRTTPGIPAGLVVSPANQQLYITWTAPSSGGAAITDYVIQYSGDSGSTWIPYSDGFSSATSATITGLTNGTAYLVRVAALNVAGTGSYVTSGSGTTPRTVPSAPTVGLPTPGNSTLSVPFTLGSNGGAAVSSIDYSLDDGVTWVTGASASSPLSLTGVTNGTTYTVRLRAVNVAGAGAVSNSATVTPRTTPGAPTLSSVVPVNTGAIVSFTQSSTGGATISDYQYSTDGGSTWLSAGVTASPVTISGLTNGTAYTVKIRAVNIAGTGTPSAGTSVTPFTTPGSPTITQVTGGNQSVTVNLSAGSTGGDAITNYEWSVDDGATWSARSPASISSSFTITGLANGTRYPVRIRAVNAAGPGDASAVANVSTNGVPSAPTINSITATHAMLSLVITPGANGGDPITNYEYSLDNGATWVTRSPASTNSNMSIAGLSDGSTYLVKVRAVNGVGSGAASLTVPGKPHTTPSTPVLNTQVDGGNQSLTVTFTPGFNGGETLSNYEYSTDRGVTWRARTDGAGTTSPMLITVLSTDGTTRLTNGVTYAVELRAVNYLGAGDASTDVSGTPKTTPDAPTISRVMPDDASATISFTAGGNGGSTITGYQFSTDGGTTWVALGTLASPARITAQSTAGSPALVNGATYQVKLRAVNAVGVGTATTAENLTPRTTPGSPSISAATPGDRTITVSFTAGGDGGATVTSYEYSTDGGTTWRTRAPGASMTSTPITITTQSSDGLTRLVNGTSYDVLIRAVNAAGSGRESLTVSAIPAGVPGTPVITSISGEDSRLRVFFTPGGPNGSAVTSTQYSLNSGSTWASAASLTSPIIIPGLTNGTNYNVILRSVNVNGPGSASLASIGKPFTRPAAPVITEAIPGNASLTLLFNAPSDGGAMITMYQYSTDNGATWRDRSFGSIETMLGIAAESSDGISALVNGNAYNVLIRAVNAAGFGAPSDAVRVMPYTTPAAPVMTSLDPSDSGADVAYTLSTNGGSPLVSIDFSTNGGLSWNSTNSTANPLHIAGLSNGSAYSIVIRARNTAGPGNMSNTRTVSPSGRPDLPQIGNVVAGDGTLTYTFTPGFDSGAPIIGYQYSIDGGVTWVTATLGADPNKFTVSGLSNGVVYNTRIRAVNANGPGVPSDVTIVKPYTVPQVPASATATANTDSITLNYSPPAFDGGQPVTGYEYSIDGGTTWVSIASPNTTSVTIPNLTNTTGYTIQLRAISAAGSGTHISVRAQAASTPVTPVVPTEIKGSAPSASTGSVTAPVTPTTTKKKTKKKTTNKTTGGSSSGSSKSTGGKSGSTSGTDGSGTTDTTVPGTTDTTVPGTNGSGSGDGSNANGKGGSGSNGGGTPLMVPGIAMTTLGGSMWFAVVLWRRRRRPQDQ